MASAHLVVNSPTQRSPAHHLSAVTWMLKPPDGKEAIERLKQAPFDWSSAIFHATMDGSSSLYRLRQTPCCRDSRGALYRHLQHRPCQALAEACGCGTSGKARGTGAYPAIVHQVWPASTPASIPSLDQFHQEHLAVSCPASEASWIP